MKLSDLFIGKDVYLVENNTSAYGNSPCVPGSSKFGKFVVLKRRVLRVEEEVKHGDHLVWVSFKGGLKLCFFLKDGELTTTEYDSNYSSKYLLCETSGTALPRLLRAMITKVVDAKLPTLRSMEKNISKEAEKVLQHKAEIRKSLKLYEKTAAELRTKGQLEVRYKVVGLTESEEP